MKVISVWNPKGGQGKSLISLNLAAAAHAQGLKPLVICEDPQGTAVLAHSAKNIPFDVRAAIGTERPDGYDLVIIDHPAGDWKIPASKTILCPVKPVRTDFATFADARKKLVGKRVIPVVTDADYRIKDERETAVALKGRGALEVRRSGVFSKAAKDYQTIYSRALDRAYKVNERRGEFDLILAAVMNEGE